MKYKHGRLRPAERIMGVLASGTKLTAVQIAAQTGLNESTVRKQVHLLTEEGRLEADRSGRAPTYRVAAGADKLTTRGLWPNGEAT